MKTIEDAGARRLRPVPLTAITTVLGLLPLGRGPQHQLPHPLHPPRSADLRERRHNVMFWGPLSWAVIYGLIFATFLTLVIVPVMFLLLTRSMHHFVPVPRLTTGEHGGVVKPMEVGV